MKYILRKYRGAFTTAALLVGALFITSTVVNVLDEVMRRKKPPSAETYVPPRIAPSSTHPITSGARSVLHAANG